MTPIDVDEEDLSRHPQILKEEDPDSDLLEGEVAPGAENPEGEEEETEALEWRRYIRLAVGECPLRNFYVARLWVPIRARANILVTNLRVVLYGVGGRGVLGRSRFVQEVHLDKIVGVEGFLGWGFNLLFLVLGALLVVVGLLPFLNLSPVLSHLATPRLNYLWYGLIAIGIALILLCFRHLFYVVVKSMALSNEVSVTARRGFGWSDGPSLQFGLKPGPDVQLIIRELGAVILDAQNGESTPAPRIAYPIELQSSKIPRMD